MSLESIITILVTILSIILYPAYALWKATMHRIEVLEKESETRISREEVKELLEDKLRPISEKTDEIRVLLYKVIDNQLKKD